MVIKFNISQTKLSLIAGHITRINFLATSNDCKSKQLIAQSLWWIASYSNLLGKDCSHRLKPGYNLNDLQRRKIWQFIQQFPFSKKGQKALQKYLCPTNTASSEKLDKAA